MSSDEDDESKHNDKHVIYESEDHDKHCNSGARPSEHTRHSQTEHDDDDGHLVKERCSFLAMRESNPLRRVWNLIVASMLVYTGTIFPYRLCFVEFKMPEAQESATLSSTVELIVDVLFWGDLAFNFFFTFKDKDGNEVFDVLRISTRYLRTFFMLNLVACLPPEAFTEIIALTSPDSGGQEGVSQSVNKSLRLIRLQRISRLARLARLTRLVKMVTFIAESPVWAWVQSLRGVRVLNFFFGLVWAVHLLACGWYLTAALHDNHLRTWIARRVVDDSIPERQLTLLDESSFIQWAHAMYFVLTVFTTVGFGDISAVTSGEILYVCFTMIVGAVVHSIIVSEMINTITSVDQTAAWRTKQKELVETWASQVNLKQQTTRALVRWTKHSETMKQGYDRDEMRKLLTNCTLPNSLLTEVSTGVFAGRLMENAFIRGWHKFDNFVPLRFPLLLALAMTQRFSQRGEVVYYSYDHAWHLFLVMSGTFANIAKPADHGGISELPPKLVHAQEVHVADDYSTPKTSGTPQLVTSEVSMRASVALELALESREDMNALYGQAEISTLYPYQLFGAGNYFGEAEIFVEQRPRQSSVRCEGSKNTGGALLVLHKNDVCAIGEEFPHIAWMWRSAARRREIHRKALLNRLTRGRSYRHFAAWTIQRVVRRRLRTGRVYSDSLAAVKKRLQRTVSLNNAGVSLNGASVTANPLGKKKLLAGFDAGADIACRPSPFSSGSGHLPDESEGPGNQRQLREDVDSLRREVFELRTLMVGMHREVLQAIKLPTSL